MENYSQVKLQLVMLQSFLSRPTLVFLSVTLTLLTVACGREEENLATQNKQKLVQPSPIGNKSNSKVLPSLGATQDSTDSQSKLESDTTLELEKAPSLLEQAEDKAAGALNISQTAMSINDWQLIVSQYQDAIALLKKIQRQTPDYRIAQNKIVEYQSRIKRAQQKANELESTEIVVSHSQEPISKITDFKLPQIISEPEDEEIPFLPTSEESEPKKEQQLSATKPPSSAGVNQQTSPQQTAPQQASSQQTAPQQTAPQQTSPQQTSPNLKTQQGMFLQESLKYNKEQVVFTMPIKRRVGGTPVIEVNFNGNRQFDMIVDTGASGTVITQNMAKSLGVETVGKAQANTASAKGVEFPIGYVDSIEAAGVQVKKLAVAIAGKELEVGLLGYDFFGDYDITIKRDVVELRPRPRS